MAEDQRVDVVPPPTSSCPVRHGEGRGPSLWSSLLPSSFQSSDKKSPSCRFAGQQAPASLEEAARHAQTPHLDQQIVLGTERQVSSIPRGEETVHHQYSSSDDTRWVYPSEQQFYNAMRKKGWSNVPEESIPTVLQIHNHINERTWREIQGWEGSKNLKMVRFEGRPNDLTPKAFVNSYMRRLYDPPFDRHDWYVENTKSNEIQRYIIDYYYLPPAQPNLPPTPYVDARPAIDQPRALWLRSRRFLQSAFPGISTYVERLNDGSDKSS